MCSSAAACVTRKAADNRLSVSWPRVVPSGAAGSGVNAKGLGFYKDLVRTLRSAGITPVVTLYHWDLPLALHDSAGGWLSRDVALRFADYAAEVARRLKARGMVQLGERGAITPAKVEEILRLAA